MPRRTRGATGFAGPCGHRTNLGLLIGQQADRRLLAAVRSRLAEQPEVDFVVDVLSMNTGTDRVLF
ncbi:hypothetical protein [Saccharopolyspora shandongensis]|uniref:hypothetical protein n=1 Tax=Saccharopolyspora shandongensis TaxID=418495 RepID=UPI0033EDB799